MSEIRLGTRGSLLALTQSRTIQAALQARGYSVGLETITTTGDRDQTQALSRIGGKGLFTRELDVALLEGRIDLAVHSLKDLPTELEAGIGVAAIPEREDPRDVLLGPERPAVPLALRTLPSGARIGTSSLRRRALASAFRPDLVVENIRGNLDTRIAKVDRGEFDAIVVAAAGLRRLGLWHRVGEALERTAWLPAPGQGALGIVTRAEDRGMLDLLGVLDHAPTRAAVVAERTVLAELGGGCQTPVGALGLPYGDGLRLWGLVASPDGTRLVRAEASGTVAEPQALGREVARLLERRGAADILASIEASAVPPLSPP